MDIILTAPQSELAGIMARTLDQQAEPRDGVRVVINLALQAPNSLLHDGHAWKRYTPTRLITETRAAVRAARADFLVHASYLFLGADACGLQVGDRLRPVIDAALAAEQIVLGSGVPACVVRLGYLYGPESRSLRAYRRAFHMGRPYWAGPSNSQQRHLHSHDAARALVAAARQRSDGRILVAADDMPASFETFMDHFAHLVGNPVPLHLPELTRALSHIVVSETHMQMVELASASIPATPRPRGFRPRFVDYSSGLAQVIDAWAG